VNAGGSDPGDLAEAVGDADALQSTALGVRNLQRVAKMILPATTTKRGEPYEDLSELYARMLGQWTLEMNHVVALVGGFEAQQKNVGQAGVAYKPVARARQMAAVQFLNQNAFVTPSWAIDKEIIRRIEPVGAISRIGNAQRSILSNLLATPRFARLVEQEALDGSASFPATDFLTAVRRGIWREVENPQVSIEAYRRQLQRNYLEIANAKLNGPSMTMPLFLPAGFPVGYFASSGDEKPFYRAELRSLSTAIQTALSKAADRTTRAHLEGARDQIARILDPRFAPAQISTTPQLRVFSDRWSATGIPDTNGDGDAQQPAAEQQLSCWPDYAIQP
jgi:hypothetical protein